MDPVFFLILSGGVTFPKHLNTGTLAIGKEVQYLIHHDSLYKILKRNDIK